jgi:hypothetical protein
LLKIDSAQNQQHKKDKPMKRKIQNLRILIAMGAIVAAQFITATLAHAEERPFRGRIDGKYVATPTQNPAIFSSEAHAVGRATHVGAFTKVTSDIVNVVTGWVEGSFIITTADGELLTGLYSGFLTPGATPGTFSWLLDAAFTGGTGRFSNATGQFVFIAEGQYVLIDGIIHGDYTETFEGTIDY